MEANPQLFSLSTCANCNRVKALLKKHNVPHDVTEVDLLKDEEKTEIVELIKVFNPNLSFPMLLVGENAITGYKEDEILEAVGKKKTGKHFFSRLWNKLSG